MYSIFTMCNLISLLPYAPRLLLSLSTYAIRSSLGGEENRGATPFPLLQKESGSCSRFLLQLRYLAACFSPSMVWHVHYFIFFCFFYELATLSLLRTARHIIHHLFINCEPSNPHVRIGRATQTFVFLCFMNLNNELVSDR